MKGHEASWNFNPCLGRREEEEEGRGERWKAAARRSEEAMRNAIADARADAELVASDLLSQAEHDPSARALNAQTI